MGHVITLSSGSRGSRDLCFSKFYAVDCGGSGYNCEADINLKYEDLKWHKDVKIKINPETTLDKTQDVDAYATACAQCRWVYRVCISGRIEKCKKNIRKLVERDWSVQIYCQPNPTHYN